MNEEIRFGAARLMGCILRRGELASHKECKEYRETLRVRESAKNEFSARATLVTERMRMCVRALHEVAIEDEHHLCPPERENRLTPIAASERAPCERSAIRQPRLRTRETIETLGD